VNGHLGILVLQGVDLLAGRAHQAISMRARAPVILVFDSGLGGLTVFRHIVSARPDARFVYIADDAAFPYGAWAEADLVQRITGLMGQLISAHQPDCVVIACNTAATLALPALRARFAVPFVGTVPAIKPAAEQSRSRVFSVLATPGTVARDYTRNLIGSFAADCDVTLVGSRHLAGLAESHMRGEPVSDEAIRAEITPCFVVREMDGHTRRTDVITLSCTHYPLLLERLQALAPWPVTWIDPAPAIARRVTHLLGPSPATSPEGDAVIGFTAGAPKSDLGSTLNAFGLNNVLADPMTPT
jgi:glutamate racemase